MPLSPKRSTLLITEYRTIGKAGAIRLRETPTGTEHYWEATTGSGWHGRHETEEAATAVVLAAKAPAPTDGEAS